MRKPWFIFSNKTDIISRLLLVILIPWIVLLLSLLWGVIRGIRHPSSGGRSLVILHRAGSASVVGGILVTIIRHRGPSVALLRLLLWPTVTRFGRQRRWNALDQLSWICEAATGVEVGH